MSFEFINTDYQILGISPQTPPPNFFRNQFLEAIAKNHFFI
jgi:hypothetical protein